MKQPVRNGLLNEGPDCGQPLGEAAMNESITMKLKYSQGKKSTYTF